MWLYSIRLKSPWAMAMAMVMGYGWGSWVLAVLGIKINPLHYIPFHVQFI